MSQETIANGAKVTRFELCLRTYGEVSVVIREFNSVLENRPEQYGRILDYMVAKIEKEIDKQILAAGYAPGTKNTP